MREDTTELQFRDVMESCLKEIQAFKDNYIDTTEEWQNFFTRGQDKTIIDAANVIRDTIKRIIEKSRERDLAQFE